MHEFQKFVQKKLLCILLLSLSGMLHCRRLGCGNLISDFDFISHCLFDKPFFVLGEHKKAGLGLAGALVRNATVLEVFKQIFLFMSCLLKHL